MQNKIMILISIILITSINSFATDSNNKNYVTHFSQSKYNAASRVSKIVDFIALQLSQNKSIVDLSKEPIAITSFVNLEDFKDTNKFGNIIAENLVHDLYIRGFNIIDFKVMPYIEIDRKGDFVFSRKLEELKGKKVEIKHLVSGTWSYYSDGIALNVRIIDIDTHAIVSSAKAFIKKDDVNDILSSNGSNYKINKKIDKIVAKILKKQNKKSDVLDIDDVEFIDTIKKNKTPYTKEKRVKQKEIQIEKEENIIL